MALPSLAKTWQYSVNNTVAVGANALATNRAVLRAIKNALLAFGTLPWTVRYSCDSTTAGIAGDAVDRWTADTNLVWANAGTAHSWIVLQQTGITSTFQVCLDLTSASASGLVLTIVLSPSAGFTGGTTTARPTATDEVIVQSNAGWGGQSANTQTVYHVMHSTDGQCNRVAICVGNTTSGFWILDKPANPVTGWSNPSLGGCGGASSASEQGTYANFSKAAGSKGRGSATMNLYFSVEGYGTAFEAVGVGIAVANDLSSEFAFFPIGLTSDTASNRGRHGSVFDLWFGPTNLSTGDTFPNDTSRTFAVFSDLVVPWNGTAVVTA